MSNRFEKSTFKIILVLLAIALLLLPFITTFNEILTVIIMKVQIYRQIQEIIVPIEAKMVSVILRVFGIPALPTSSSIIFSGNTKIVGKSISISWNCIGWQSFILLIITFVSGLQGPYTWSSKINTIIIGVLGTFWVNILRITFVIFIAYYINYFWAIIFHDYFSTFITIAWLMFFWWFSFKFVLEK